MIDNPPCNVFEDVSLVVDFIHAVYNGFSCLSFAKSCAAAILRQSEEDTITLLDGIIIVQAIPVGNNSLSVFL